MKRSRPEPMVTLIFAMLLLCICLAGIVTTMSVIFTTSPDHVIWPFMWSILVISAVCGIVGCVLFHKLAKQLR